jgi:hypothetical protein
MAEQKTKPTGQKVTDFLDKVEPQEKRKDSYEILAMMKDITGVEPYMWGPSIVGFGTYHYKYDSGHEGDTCITGFSPRKPAITLYVLLGLGDKADLLKKLGPHKASKGCLYIKRLSDIDKTVLKRIIESAVTEIKRKGGETI